MINESFDLSNVSLVVPSAEVVSWDSVVAICGRWDDQALYSSFVGLFLSLVIMFWWGRLRHKVGWSDKALFFVDKFLFTFQSMLWVVVIVRLLRAG